MADVNRWNNSKFPTERFAILTYILPVICVNISFNIDLLIFINRTASRSNFFDSVPIDINI